MSQPTYRFPRFLQQYQRGKGYVGGAWEKIKMVFKKQGTETWPNLSPLHLFQTLSQPVYPSLSFYMKHHREIIYAGDARERQKVLFKKQVIETWHNLSIATSIIAHLSNVNVFFFLSIFTTSKGKCV